MKVYRTEDASLEPLAGKTIAILGYGIQGSAQAQNLRDSGLNVIVGGRPGKSSDAAKADGFYTHSFVDAAEKADIVCLMTPDPSHAEVYAQIRSALPGKTLVFAHGSSIHFGWIRPDAGIDVVLIAPSGSGRTVRESFLSQKGMVATFAVHQDASGRAKVTALALCKALGFLNAGVFESSFKDEAVCDLFGEQAVLCGGVPELVRYAYQTLVDKGYSKEMAYLGTLYELRSLADLYASAGLDGMLERVSEAARFGGLVAGPKTVGPETKVRMAAILDEIESGRFMQEFSQETKTGFACTRQMLEKEKTSDMSRTGERIRKRFTL